MKAWWTWSCPSESHQTRVDVETPGWLLYCDTYQGSLSFSLSFPHSRTLKNTDKKIKKLKNQKSPNSLTEPSFAWGNFWTDIFFIWFKITLFDFSSITLSFFINLRHDDDDDDNDGVTYWWFILHMPCFSVFFEDLNPPPPPGLFLFSKVVFFLYDSPNSTAYGRSSVGWMMRRTNNNKQAFNTLFPIHHGNIYYTTTFYYRRKLFLTR